MSKKYICEVCHTAYDADLDYCPVCDTPRLQEAPEEEYEERPRHARWKSTALVVLCVLFVVLGGFIAYEFLLGQPTVDTGLRSCTGLYLSETELRLDQPGDSVTLVPHLTPEDTTDVVTYACADSSVALVDEQGTVIAVSEGQTQVTVTCGGYSAQCSVICGPAQ